MYVSSVLAATHYDGSLYRKHVLEYRNNWYHYTQPAGRAGLLLHINHHVQHLSSGGDADVLPVPSGDGFEAENSINFLGQSILFHNLLSFTLWSISDGTLKSFCQLINDFSSLQNRHRMEPEVHTHRHRSRGVVRGVDGKFTIVKLKQSLLS